jgi:hypothetical protein
MSFACKARKQDRELIQQFKPESKYSHFFREGKGRNAKSSNFQHEGIQFYPKR